MHKAQGVRGLCPAPLGPPLPPPSICVGQLAFLSLRGRARLRSRFQRVSSLLHQYFAKLPRGQFEASRVEGHSGSQWGRSKGGSTIEFSLFSDSELGYCLSLNLRWCVFPNDSTQMIWQCSPTANQEPRLAVSELRERNGVGQGTTLRQGCICMWASVLTQPLHLVGHISSQQVGCMLLVSMH